MKQNNKKHFFMRKIANLLNVGKIVTIHYQALEKNYVSVEEQHSFWEINYADKGDITLVRGDEKSVLRQGEIAFIKPDQPHYVMSGDNEPNIFIISFDCRSEGMSFFFDKTLTVPENYRYLLQNIMTEAIETFQIPDFDPDLNELKLRKNPNLGGEQVIKNSLELLLIYILRGAEQKPSSQEFFISKISNSSDLQDEIVRCLNAKLYDSFSLDDLCEQLHYSKTFLCTFFQKKTGMSIYQTYLKLKVDEAKRFIRKKMQFSDISAKLGFDSVSHFSRVFKKYVGMTPTEYKISIK